MKHCYIIAGPNGAGKTTFAQDYLPQEANCPNFINVDLIAAGLSPFEPERVAIRAGRIMLKTIDDCVRKGETFAFETTLSGVSYARKIKSWKSAGYHITIYYLMVPNEEFAIERVKFRVSQGGHNVPEQDIRRRYKRSWKNFENTYKQLADEWALFDTRERPPLLIEEYKYNGT